MDLNVLRFLEDLLKHCDKVKTFYTLEEPTLIKQHFAFLEKLVEYG